MGPQKPCLYDTMDYVTAGKKSLPCKDRIPLLETKEENLTIILQ